MRIFPPLGKYYKCGHCGRNKIPDWRLTGPTCPVCDLTPPAPHLEPKDE